MDQVGMLPGGFTRRGLRLTPGRVGLGVGLLLAAADFGARSLPLWYAALPLAAAGAVVLITARVTWADSAAIVAIGFGLSALLLPSVPTRCYPDRRPRPPRRDRPDSGTARLRAVSLASESIRRGRATAYLT